MFAWIALIILVFGTAYFRVAARYWVPIFAIILFFFTSSQFMGLFSSVIAWLIWILLSGFMVMGVLRQQIFTKPLIRWFKKQQPQLSDDEIAVLEAGGLWFEQEFFKGAPDWNKLLAYPKAQLSNEEQAYLDNQVAKLCNELDDWQIIHGKKDLSEPAWTTIKQEKFLGLIIDKHYQGLGFSPLMHSTVVGKIATRSHSAAINVMVPNSLGPAEFLHRYGTDEQKSYYLPRLADGREIPCFALTSPEAGSDATSISDRGDVCYGMYAGKQIIGIRLNFNKRYITLAPIATLIGLAFKLYDPEHLLGDKEAIGITLALIPAAHPGVEIGHRHYPLNLAFMNGPIRGADVFIPLDWIIGGLDRRGQGWQMMMECLSVGRGISLPALAVGTMQVCYRVTGAYAKIRQQFQRPVGEFEGVQEALSRIGGFCYLSEAARIFTSMGVAEDAKPAVASAITKYHLTEMSRKAVADAMDVHAGRAIQTGPRNYLANIHDGIPTAITVEGANILTRNLIIYGQGAIRCHPYLRSEIAAADASHGRKVTQFDRLILRHIGLILQNFTRTFWYGITHAYFIKTPKTRALQWHLRQLTRMSTVFALSSDLTLAYLGKQLKIKEAISARLGDFLSFLYLSSSVIYYFHSHEEPENEKVYVDWTIQYCLHQMYVRLAEVFENYPRRWLGRIILWFCFPFSKGYRYPKDALSFELAKTLLNPGALRDKLTHLCYISDDAADPIARVERAFIMAHKSESLFQKIRQAVLSKQLSYESSLADMAKTAYNKGIISIAERDQLIEYEKLRQDAIAVDEFAKL